MRRLIALHRVDLCPAPGQSRFRRPGVGGGLRHLDRYARQRRLRGAARHPGHLHAVPGRRGAAVADDRLGRRRSRSGATTFLGVPADEGNAFAELNANSAGTLYQDVVTTPGSTMSWTLIHRAREGTDVMQVLIGDANVADVNGATGWDFIVAGHLATTRPRGERTAPTMSCPPGRPAPASRSGRSSTGSGNASVGNFLDAVGVHRSRSRLPPTPTPPPAATVLVRRSRADGRRRCAASTRAARRTAAARRSCSRRPCAGALVTAVQTQARPTPALDSRRSRGDRTHRDLRAFDSATAPG